MFIGKLGLINDKLVVGFFKWGWLIPAFLPVFEIIGRGVFNSVAGLYVAWGVLILINRGFGDIKPIVWLFFILILSYSFGVIGAEDIGRAGHKWAKYTFFSLTLFFTILALHEHRENEEKYFTIIAVGALVALPILFIFSFAVSGGERFVLYNTMYERNLPFLLPFIISFGMKIKSAYLKYLFISLIYFTVLMIIIFSGGRAALAGLLMVTFLFLFKYLKIKLRTILLCCILLIISIFSLNSSFFLRGLDNKDLNAIDSFSSRRTLFWRNAIQTPPDNILFGVGMGNVRYERKLFSETVIKNNKVINKQYDTKHLHNFFLDCWYETGTIGLLAFCFLNIYILLRVFYAWKYFSKDENNRVFTVLMSVSAIFTSGSFSFSYHSQQFSVYLFFLYGIICFITEHKLTVKSNSQLLETEKGL